MAQRQTPRPTGWNRKPTNRPHVGGRTVSDEDAKPVHQGKGSVLNTRAGAAEYSHVKKKAGSLLQTAGKN